MINDINNKILKLEKKKLMVQILSIVFWVLSFKVSADSINYVMPMTELMIYITNNFPIFVLLLIIRNSYEPYNTHQAVFFIVK